MKDKHTLVVELDMGVFSVSDGVVKRLRYSGVDGADKDDGLSKVELAQG